MQLTFPQGLLFSTAN